MSRFQLALNVSDLDEAVAFYTKLFGAEPAKVRPGYANFADRGAAAEARADRGRRRARDAEPPRCRGRVARRGRRRARRLAAEGLATAIEDEVACCYAVQDKVWVDAPDGEPWEIYTVLADVETRAPAIDRVRALVGRRSPRLAAADVAGRPRQAATAEAVGTGFLVAVVVGSGIVAQRLSPNDIGLQLLENSIATGAGLVALILAFSRSRARTSTPS